MPSPIPLRDAEYDAFLYNWSTTLTANPTTFGMVAADATAITAAYTAWHAAYVAASNVLTRTRATILQKNIEKAASLVLLREQYQIIKANPSVTDADKTDIGVRVNDPTPTVIPAPTTYPVLSVVQSAPLEHSIMAVDNTTPTSRAKPAGVVGMLVVRSIGVAAAVDPTQCDFMGFYTRVPFAAEAYDAGDAGKIATFFSRWTNAKGEEGPWSAPVSKIIGN